MPVLHQEVVARLYSIFDLKKINTHLWSPDDFCFLYYIFATYSRGVKYGSLPKFFKIHYFSS